MIEHFLISQMDLDSFQGEDLYGNGVLLLYWTMLSMKSHWEHPVPLKLQHSDISHKDPSFQLIPTKYYTAMY